MRAYSRAISRGDLSEYLVHLSGGALRAGFALSPAQVLRSILREGRVQPSITGHILRYEPNGAACFYDVPFTFWDELISTNPNGRQGFGLIVHKKRAWQLGGRPVIYTDRPDLDWPASERFRLVRTDLAHYPPWDWMHEREWRFRGGLEIYRAPGPSDWWWPCVPLLNDAHALFREFPNVHWVHVMQARRTIGR
jgi:hypothetical protein